MGLRGVRRDSHDGEQLDFPSRNYLQETEESQRIEALLEKPQIDVRQWRGLVEQVLSAREVGELKGQVARMLGSTPDHPGLLYLRALTEAMTPNGDLGEVKANLRAAMEAIKEGYRHVVIRAEVVGWDLLEGVEHRAPFGIEPALAVLEETGLGSRLARRCLQQARDPRILGRAMEWMLCDLVSAVEGMAGRHRCS